MKRYELTCFNCKQEHTIIATDENRVIRCPYCTHPHSVTSGYVKEKKHDA